MLSLLPDIILILLLGLIVGWGASRLRLPVAVGQVLLGIVIGPPLLGWIHTDNNLRLLGELGVLLLLGMAGLRLGLDRLIGVGMTGLWVALLGMVFCLAGGYGFAAWWGSPAEEAIYIGVALTATSIAISVQLLHQFGLVERKVGRIVIAAAVIDDILALYLLATAHGVLSNALAPARIVASVVMAAVILVAIFMACRWLARQLAQASFPIHPIYLLPVIVAVIVSFGWLTHTLGYSQVVGGFFAGLGLGEGLHSGQRDRLGRQLNGIVMVLVPFFFVLIGGRAEWQVLMDPGMPTLVAGLLVVAIVGKAVGGMLGSVSTGNLRQQLLVGMSMVPRGEVILVIAGLGFAQAISATTCWWRWCW
jgi:Kef-type K+ transport system membrane component KefB